ncbi:uncharacterized protein EV154DRAFT_414891, partial [Mucor mucedo]|uniref:uncharacterized protein n=1 Tax=Mucor mucedo TaxID=29922 RepID=UPI00221ED87D
GNREWNDGTRSDMVLEPKSGHSNLPPIILEIQHTVNLAFMKRAVTYCIQATNRYDIDPIILIICVDKLYQDIHQHMKPSTLPGVFSYFSQPWAQKCYLISKESIKNNMTIPLDPMVALGAFLTSNSTSLSNHHFKDDPPWAQKCYLISKESIKDNMTIPLDPMVALGAFFTSNSTTLSNHHFKDDPTIQYLYTSSLFQHQVETVNQDTPFKLMDLQIMEYDRLKTLASSLKEPVFEEAVNEAKSRTLSIKRKYEESFPLPRPANKTDKNNETYKSAMEFVAGFKQKKFFTVY